MEDASRRASSSASDPGSGAADWATKNKAHMKSRTLHYIVCALLLAVSPVSAATRAMWAWDMEDQQELLRFAREHQVSVLFLQYSAKTDERGLRAFLRAARQQRLEVHALDGWPEAVLPENHAEVLNEIQAILKFNAGSAPEERWSGFHLDAEPYLLLGWDSPLQSRIGLWFTELTQKVAAALAGKDLEFGMDVPFWFNPATSLQGNIAIMDYRNAALGGDGIIRLGRDMLTAAGREKKRAFIGVETEPAGASRVVFVHGFPAGEWAALTPQQFPLLLSSRFEGFRLNVMHSGGKRFVGLAEPPEAGKAEAFQTALAHLAAMVGARDGRFTREIPGYAKTTFAGHTEAEMEHELELVETALRDQPGFAGFAIHHYRSWRLLTETPHR